MGSTPLILPHPNPVAPRLLPNCKPTAGIQVLSSVVQLIEGFDADRNVDDRFGRQAGNAGRPDVLDQPPSLTDLSQLLGCSANAAGQDGS
ncbi:hypothetical protein GCM10011575_28830 [Microlunatus endophyticus]|uniref:Uncharacterized protein n=1 Tax=Microlunatus endophyticus TaxID=1716077 RepID=A0A917SCR3_9ACTN|nr:hypothetical protein GCM10011575_28830 [Microlunatus endophyticus]